MTKVTLRIDGQRSVDMVDLAKKIISTTAEFKGSEDAPTALTPHVHAKLVALFTDLVDGVGVEQDTIFLQNNQEMPARGEAAEIIWDRDEGDDLVEAIRTALPENEGPRFWLVGHEGQEAGKKLLVASYSYQQEPPVFVTRVWARD